MQNAAFFYFARVSLFRSKKHSLLSRISKYASFLLFLLKKNIWWKGRFFDKNYGLTPLQIVDFFRLCENFTFQVQKALFSIQNIKNVSFWLFLLKKKIWEKGRFFDKNHGITPFKMPIFLTLLEVHFSGLKSIIYYPEYQKMFLSCFVYSQKKTYKNKVEFLQKPCSNPFAKFPFFWLC